MVFYLIYIFFLKMTWSRCMNTHEIKQMERNGTEESAVHARTLSAGEMERSLYSARTPELSNTVIARFFSYFVYKLAPKNK